MRRFFLTISYDFSANVFPGSSGAFELVFSNAYAKWSDVLAGFS